jgi:hypothetical protein
MASKFSETKEFYDLVKEFEKIFSHYRLNKESKELYSREHFYQDGDTNRAFIAFMNGYQLAKSIYQ